MSERAAFAAWWEEHGLGDFGRQRDAWDAATQRQQERIAQLEAEAEGHHEAFGAVVEQKQALAARVAQFESTIQSQGGVIVAMRQERDAALAQVLALAPDAARYYYLSRIMGDLCITIADENTGPVLKAAAADSHIDAAIAASKGEAS